ncbi:MAG TPA: hypothetical protein PLX66_00700 [Bacilli bacterium]|nr:hypothetical protein [Bacilli bacterium]
MKEKYDTYAAEEEAVLHDDDYPQEGQKPSPEEKRVEELLNSLTPEELQEYADDELTREDIKAKLMEMVTGDCLKTDIPKCK